MLGGAYLKFWLRGEGLIREGGLIELLRYAVYFFLKVVFYDMFYHNHYVSMEFVLQI